MTQRRLTRIGYAVFLLVRDRQRPISVRRLQRMLALAIANSRRELAGRIVVTRWPEGDRR